MDLQRDGDPGEVEGRSGVSNLDLFRGSGGAFGGLRWLWLSLVIAAVCGCGESADTVEAENPNDRWPVEADSGLRYPALGPVPALPVWPDNPPSAEKAALGRLLFNDPRLSGSGRVGCGACHFQNTYFQSSTPQDVPDRSYPEISPRLPRNAPSLLNIVYAENCRWDGGHCESLPAVLMLPFAEANMNLTPGVARDDVHTIDVPGAQAGFRRRMVEQIPGYVPLYEAAFGVDISQSDAEEIWALGGAALAVLMRDAVSRDAPFDAWNAGDDDAMGPEAVRGFEIFVGKGGCVSCHYGPMFTDFGYHNMSREAVADDGSREDEGRFLITGNDADKGKFLTPTLRSVVFTAPWWHDGGETDLRRLLAHITGPEGKADPLHDPILDGIEPLAAAETEDLLQFLKALTGTHPDPVDFTAPVESFPNIDTVPVGVSPG